MTPTTAPIRMPAWLEQAWLVRYLDRQLDGAEAAWFEGYVLDKPELLTMIDADTHLRDSLAADTSAGRKDAPPLEERSAVKPADATIGPAVAGDKNSAGNVTQITQRRRVLPSWAALAAALVLGLGAGGLGMRSLAPDHGADVVISPTQIIYDAMRGDAGTRPVEHNDGRSTYVLIETAVPPGAEDITLHIEGVQDQPLTPSRDGFVSFLVNRLQLDQGKVRSIEYRMKGEAKIEIINLPLPKDYQR